MLALSRKKGEALIINNNIEVTILEIKGDQVKIGIGAPKEVPIYRKEVYVQIQEANKAATEVSGLDMRAFYEGMCGVNLCMPEFFGDDLQIIAQ